MPDIILKETYPNVDILCKNISERRWSVRQVTKRPGQIQILSLPIPTAVLLTMTLKWKQHKCPSAEGCGTVSQWTIIHLQKEMKFWFMLYGSTLKLNIQKTKILASGPITSWRIEGETMETGTDFISLGSKITAVGDFSHEIKRRLVLGRKVMTNLDSIWKSRHHFANKGACGQSFGFSSSHVWMWELDYKEKGK